MATDTAAVGAAREDETETGDDEDIGLDPMYVDGAAGETGAGMLVEVLDGIADISVAEEVAGDELIDDPAAMD